LIEIINKQLLLQLVGYLCYWQMGFNSVFKGLRYIAARSNIPNILDIRMALILSYLF